MHNLWCREIDVYTCLYSAWIIYITDWLLLTCDSVLCVNLIQTQRRSQILAIISSELYGTVYGENAPYAKTPHFSSAAVSGGLLWISEVLALSLSVVHIRGPGKPSIVVSNSSSDINPTYFPVSVILHVYDVIVHAWNRHRSNNIRCVS